MNQFNILEPQLKLHQNYLLEASAGTGKTFSIENIVVRLLIEEHPETGSTLSIEEILAVTFTRAAASDLKTRIRSNIQNALSQLQTGKITHPYLQSYLDRGEHTTRQAIKRLEQALFCFDQAQIYTIHSFCAKMLSENLFEGKINLTAQADEEGMPKTEVRRIVRNFFRTEITPDNYCPAQIELLLKHFSQEFHRLEQEIAHIIDRRLPIQNSPGFQELYQRYCRIMKEIKTSHPLKSEEILEDFEKQMDAYKKYEDVGDPVASVRRFALQFNQETPSLADFEALIQEDLVFVRALAPERMKKKKQVPVELHYPELWKLLQLKLLPCIEEARSAACTFAKMAHGCQRLLTRYCDEEEKTSFDALLIHMEKALENPAFAENVRSQYRAAIIDEFQDTDPTQWNIFKTLFYGSPHCLLYIVGDPKQSIYSFRQADIYTYLAAGEALGKEHQATLDTNFRSEKSLIHALNTLFSASNCPNMIQLPRTQSTLPYHEVQAGGKTLPKNFHDPINAVHFCIAQPNTARKNAFPLNLAENNFFYPYIVQEIQRLHQKEGLHYQSFAVLVASHHQANTLAQFLEHYGIPCSKQRCSSLNDSPALGALREIFNATLDFKDESALRVALGGKILQFDSKKLLALDHVHIKEKCIANFSKLQEALHEKGFSAFYEALMNSRWHVESEETVNESLLKGSSPLEFYQDLQQIAELLMELQCSQHPNAEGLLAYLDEFPMMKTDDDPRIKQRSDPQRDAVTLITIHSSKGLEYDVVFALGLVNRTSDKNLLIPVFEKGQWMLTSSKSERNNYLLEKDAEKMRQLYVAMTRAKHRLYLPTLLVENAEAQCGEASPMELFLAKLAGPPATAEELYQRINSGDTSKFFDFIQNHTQQGISHTLLNTQEFHLEKQPPEPVPNLYPPKAIAIPGIDLYMQSFSSLALESQAAPQEILNAPHNFFVAEKTPHTLPAGSETGNLLHTLLENLSFDQKEIIHIVDHQTKNSKYSEWNGCLAAILHNALHCRLDDFSLHQVPNTATYREMEFVYPIDDTMPWIEEVEYQPGYLKGIIDLIFSHQGKYYLLDWKSNWLGESTEDYSEANMDRAMHQHHYYLQAALYKKALERYLALTDPRPFEEIFGGTFYLFLRGLSTAPESQTGILKIAPQQGAFLS